ncbi:potassium channel protein [Deferribacter desulfuricans SSM1]|uniref:Potassium channel protein n=1 Tax=Deferribacter desulfuricans (strain DSM 14783 / JCM 11476 / NBRC 101012 / SSM1) TaxID=639282 RepID=D3PCZ6_DEFDS|nr:potassium channel protein [Deferribacter desulfuricans]BAI80469.1 potassium channel protein [Deferribacter desulfuricans SSM1]
MLKYKVRNILIGFVVLLLIVAVGTLGYESIEKAGFLNSLFMTIITISTVGYEEVFPLSEAGKYFTIFLILTGTGTLAYIGTQVFDLIIAGEIGRTFGRRRMDKKISKLNDHYIICGYGRMGKIIASQLKEKGIPFVVIEKDEKYINEFDEKDYYYIIGDATKEDTLVKANILYAKGIISVVESDAENVYITLTAKGFNQDIKVFTKAMDDEASSKMFWAGADNVISPFTTGALQIANAIVKPNVTEFLELALGKNDYNIEVEELAICQNSKLKGKTILESNLRKFGIIVIAIKKSDGSFIYSPSAEEVLNDNDVLICLGRRDDFDELKKYLRS